jgi:hypothetical protein
MSTELLTRQNQWTAPAVCVAAAVASGAAFFVQGIGASGGTGADVTQRLEQDAGAYQSASILAIYAAVGLCLAAVRLGRRIGGDAGRLAATGGTAVAILLAASFSVYAAGGAVTRHVLDTAGPGVGEAALVLLNVVELARYAPGVLLLAAVLAGRHRLPRAVTVSAVLVLVAAVVPMTAWLAALVIPVWLGVAGAFAGQPLSSRR